MGYSLLKTVFPNFGETSTYVEHNYRQILDSPAQTTTGGSLATPITEDFPEIKIPDYPTIKKIEQFEDQDHHTTSPSPLHIDYSHILKCKECRDLLQKQFNKDSLIDDSLIEIGMYVLFGAFILVLLEQK